MEVSCENFYGEQLKKASYYILAGYIGICPYVRTGTPLYKLFLTDCHETSHTCSQTSSLIRIRKWASQVTCKPPPPNRGLLPPLKIQIPLILMKFRPYVLATIQGRFQEFSVPPPPNSIAPTPNPPLHPPFTLHFLRL